MYQVCILYDIRNGKYRIQVFTEKEKRGYTNIKPPIFNEIPEIISVKLNFLCTKKIQGPIWYIVSLLNFLFCDNLTVISGKYQRVSQQRI